MIGCALRNKKYSIDFVSDRTWRAKRECKKKEPRRAFIDGVGPDLK